MNVFSYSFYLFYMLKFPNKRIVFPSPKQKNKKKKKILSIPFIYPISIYVNHVACKQFKFC